MANHYNQFRDVDPGKFLSGAIFKTNLKNMQPVSMGDSRKFCLMNNRDYRSQEKTSRHKLPVAVVKYQNRTPEFRSTTMEKQGSKFGFRRMSNGPKVGRENKKLGTTYFKGAIEIVNRIDKFERIINEDEEEEDELDPREGGNVESKNQSTTQSKTKPQVLKDNTNMLLSNCNIIPKGKHSFLNKKNGVLCSNPLNTIGELSKLYY